MSLSGPILSNRERQYRGMADESDAAQAREELKKLMDKFDADGPEDLLRTLATRIPELENELVEREDLRNAVEDHPLGDVLSG